MHANFIAHAVKKTFMPLTMVGQLWQAYALPGILYASEVIVWDETNLKSLDTIQNSLIKNMLKLPQYTTSVGLEIISGITPVWWYFMCRKLGYLQTI